MLVKISIKSSKIRYKKIFLNNRSWGCPLSGHVIFLKNRLKRLKINNVTAFLNLRQNPETCVSFNMVQNTFSQFLGRKEIWSVASYMNLNEIRPELLQYFRILGNLQYKMFQISFFQTIFSHFFINVKIKIMLTTYPL